jgi:FKBP-type peptidyl-prolyl cis-trans isomerase FklB
MKKILVPVLVLMSVTAMAQTKPKPAVHAAPQPVFKNTNDSLSYAIGISVANFYKEQGVTTVNTALVSKAINDLMKNGKPLLTDQQCNTVIMAAMQKARNEKSEVSKKEAAAAKKEGEAFLTENKTKPGVVELPSGLQYLILKEGDGPKPTATDKVKCHYHGTFTDGTVFESSVERGEPIVFNVNGVIAGWTEALQLMPVGSKWRLFIPSNLAYGDQANGKIKAGSTLIFEVELIDIEK